MNPTFGPRSIDVSSLRSVVLTRNARSVRWVVCATTFGAIVLGAVTFALALAAGTVPAEASVPLPVLEQASGMPTLAPVLKKITPAVVSVAIKGHAAETGGQRKTRDVKQAADHQVRAAG